MSISDTNPNLDRAATLRQAAQYAEAHQNWASALASWHELAIAQPGDARAALGTLICLTRLGRLQEADAYATRAHEHFPQSREIAHRFATLPSARNDHATAASRWRKICDRSPNWNGAKAGLAASLNLLRNHADAEQVLDAALIGAPDDFELLSESARTATWRQDWPAAAERWRAVQTGFPTKPAGYAGRVSALHRGGETAASLDLAEEAAAKFPNDFDVQAERARSLAANGHADASIQAWLRMQQSFPHWPQTYSEPVGQLRKLGRLNEGIAICDAGLQLFPQWHVLLAERAHLSANREDWADALHFWKLFLASQPQNRMGRIGSANALIHLHKLPEAIRLIDKLLAEAPGHLPTMILRAQADMAAEDWHSAIDRMTTADRIAPGDKLVASILFAARMRVAMSDDHANLPIATAEHLSAPGPEQETLRNRDLMAQFESLGDNCEFGLVQRHFGAEPLGLLRWSAITFRNLLTILETEFAGVGDPEFTNLVAEAREYITTDTRYGMATHTFIPLNAQDAPRLQQQLFRRLRFLSRKLMEDLRDGQKIFVYKGKHDLSDEQALAIADRLSCYGPARLLIARHATAQHKPGEISQLSPAIYIGYLSKFGRYKIEGEWAIAFEDWLNVCRNAAPACLRNY